MKFSIVPEMLTTQRIELLDEKDIPVQICKPSKFKYISPFQEPFVIIDTFAKKTSQQKELRNLYIDELKTFGFVLTTIKAGKHRWFSRQMVIYRIEPISNISPGSKKINNIPGGHRIEIDVANENKIRLVGPNAGFPRRGDGGPWIQTKT